MQRHFFFFCPPPPPVLGEAELDCLASQKSAKTADFSLSRASTSRPLSPPSFVFPHFKQQRAGKKGKQKRRAKPSRLFLNFFRVLLSLLPRCLYISPVELLSTIIHPCGRQTQTSSLTISFTKFSETLPLFKKGRRFASSDRNKRRPERKVEERKSPVADRRKPRQVLIGEVVSQPFFVVTKEEKIGVPQKEGKRNVFL